MKVRSYYKTIIFTFFISAQGDTCEYIDDQYERRRGKYNGRLAETSFVEHTENTNKLLSNYNKVSSVPATLDQKKSIIKTTMAKFFVHANPEKHKLSFRTLKENDKNYRHFKILERTEVLSSELAKQLIDKDGVKTIDRDFLSNQWSDHKELDEFGQITQEMFALWFNEALADHNRDLSKAIATAFVKAAPTSPRRFTQNLSVAIIDRKQKYGDLDSQHFSSISHEKVFSEKELPSDSNTQSTNSSTTTLPERLSDLTTDHVDTSPNSSEMEFMEFSASEFLKISDHTFEKALMDMDDDDHGSTATDYDTDQDELADFERISPTKQEINNAANKEQDAEWDDLSDDKSPGKNESRKDTQSYTALIAGVLQKITLWS